MVTKEQVIEVAKQCFDPEIPVNIWDLGLIYDIEIREETREVYIRMSLTSQGCPSAKEIPMTLKHKIMKDLGVPCVKIDVVFEPLWTPERITADGKKKLGIETE